MAADLDPLSALSWLVDAGADEAVLDAPVNRLVARAPAAQIPAGIPTQKAASPSSFLRPQPEKKSPPAVAGDSVANAMEVAARCNTLAELKTAMEAFDGCTLKKSAINTVFADGTPAHRIMFIGEAPGRDEDKQGLPFVGRAGQLLDKMLASIGLDRKTNAYITNVINWRPPDNRDPTPEEVAICRPFLRRHIELVNPGIIILLGAVSARHVLGLSDGIMRLRGHWKEYFVSGHMVPVMPTLHPAYLLRRPIDKKLAWRDLQAIQDRIKDLGLLERQA